MSRATESLKTVQEAQARHQQAVDQVQSTEEVHRRLLIKKVQSEDVPRQLELCHSAIDSAAKLRRRLVEVELGSFDGDREQEQEYPWNLLYEQVAALLQEEGYGTAYNPKHEEVDDEGRGGKTSVRILIRW